MAALPADGQQRINPADLLGDRGYAFLPFDFVVAHL
jgi:hypothetical protein